METNESAFHFSRWTWSDNARLNAVVTSDADGLLKGYSPVSVLISSAAILGLIGYVLAALFENKYGTLKNIPGPWYAPFTTIHLRYFFARGTIWKYVDTHHAQHGDFVRLGPRQVWIANKAALKKILATVDLPKVTMYAEISRDRNSPGLFGEIRHDPHKRLKKFLAPAFTVTSVDKLDSFFMACTGVLLQNYYELVNKEGSGSLVPIKTDLMRDLHCLALDIMGQSTFGKGFGQIDKIFDPARISSVRDKKWAKIPNAIFDGLANRYRFVFIKRALRRLGITIEFDWPKSMTTAISELIDERLEQKSEQRSQRIDLLQHMLDNGKRPDSGERMSNQDIIDQMSELLLAGSETTSGTIGCLFLELARNPTVRAKLLHSLPVLGPTDPVLDSKTVREDPQYRYLEACIKENLRMHPIASEMGRRTIKEPLVTEEHEIPPYTVVSASYRNLHWDKRYWPNPEVFWPERWLQGTEMHGAPAPDYGAYYPFSAGKHYCIGQNFAYAEIRTVSANILSRFDVSECGYKDIDFRQFITMQFSDGSWNAILTPRWGQDTQS